MNVYRYFVRVESTNFEEYCNSKSLTWRYSSLGWHSSGDSHLYIVVMSTDDELAMKLGYPTLGIVRT